MGSIGHQVCNPQTASLGWREDVEVGFRKAHILLKTSGWRPFRFAPGHFLSQAEFSKQQDFDENLIISSCRCDQKCKRRKLCQFQQAAVSLHTGCVATRFARSPAALAQWIADLMPVKVPEAAAGKVTAATSFPPHQPDGSIPD